MPFEEGPGDGAAMKSTSADRPETTIFCLITRDCSLWRLWLLDPQSDAPHHAAHAASGDPDDFCFSNELDEVIRAWRVHHSLHHTPDRGWDSRLHEQVSAGLGDMIVAQLREELPARIQVVDAREATAPRLV